MPALRIVSASLLFLLVLSIASPAFGQRRFNFNKKKDYDSREEQDKMKRYKVEGTVTGVRADALRLETKNSEAPVAIVLLDLERTKLVMVKGEAHEGFLAPRMAVRFAAMVDRRGIPTEPIESITVFEPGPESEPGIFPQDPTDPNGTYDIIGTIKSAKQNRLTVVTTGRQQVRAMLAENPEILIEVSDHSLAREGDQARVIAWGHNAAELIAEEVHIQLADPVGEPAKRSRRSPTDRRSSRSRETTKNRAPR